MILVITGLPGAGKSLLLARKILGILERNRKMEKRTGLKRQLYTNLKLSNSVMDYYKGYIREWTDSRQLTQLRDCDVVWDELAAALDATQWQNMSLELKRWLQQHRKKGVDIYGTAQDFAQVDKSFRRLVSQLLYITKLVGSRDKSATMPDPKYVWGICVVRELDAQKYDEAESKFQGVGLLPHFMLIDKSDIAIYDTTAEVAMGEYPPLRHISRSCELDACTHVKTIHV